MDYVWIIYMGNFICLKRLKVFLLKEDPFYKKLWIKF